ncbi:FG-GAP-like repeat-containing protein [Rhodohalobacter sp. 614A]|uniref:FG-GAP-like repeat-containing protein n=1 Tax=Rhodohalobacter sp. 614A TaxID=2908649 RepID=UPI001F274A93|nr:FG-GAP-like repeat-containing protein [Rhodohalobacter sp. 614A]
MAKLLLIVIVILAGCNREVYHFESISSDISQVTFQNNVTETRSNNILNNEYFYNGAGIGVADFDKDGYPDLYFAGNQVKNRMYLNKGDFVFEDITESVKVEGKEEKWYSGVSVVDINMDGWPDVYLSVTGSKDAALRKNELYINQGPDNSGKIQFMEMAGEYGIDDSSYTTHAIFTDIDRDGDLDLYLLVADTDQGMSALSNRVNIDRLYRNEGADSTGQIIYTDISEEAGITKAGFALGGLATDINQDGFVDIYVANDYMDPDFFWINNGDGTFTDRIYEMFSHTSFSSMGTDAADIDWNGRIDLFTLDMYPDVNVRRKMMANPNNYQNYITNGFEGNGDQFTRNTLQYNVGSIEEHGIPTFSEIAWLAGVEATDWSWGSLFFDMNNDAYSDLFVTNGIPKDITDKDFWREYGRVRSVISVENALRMMSGAKISNKAFVNNRDLTFSDVTNPWGFNTKTYSTGVVYADLDKNGAIDLIVQNINQPVSIYRNNLYQKEKENAENWLKLSFEGPENNSMGVGAVIDVYSQKLGHQRIENTPYRGYLSSVDPLLHIGLGQIATVDSLIVTWPIGEESYQNRYKNIGSNQILTISFDEAEQEKNTIRTISEPFFKKVDDITGISYQHKAEYTNDFYSQPLLPYKISDFGPVLASGDIDGNGLEDLFIGATRNNEAEIYFQQEDGTFISAFLRELVDHPEQLSLGEHTSVLLADFDGDDYPDLYFGTVSTSDYSSPAEAEDFVFKNNGDGTFTLIQHAFPYPNIQVTSVVEEADYNNDGLPDLFIGGGYLPDQYPMNTPNKLFINRSDTSTLRFEEDTTRMTSALSQTGTVLDAVWLDFNHDEVLDLVVAGEWMRVSFFENQQEGFVDVTDKVAPASQPGMWKHLQKADLNGDGLMDLFAGNHGLNSLYSGTSNEPVSIYYGDLFADNFFEALPTVFLKDTSGQKHEYPAHYFEDVRRLIPGLANRYATYREFGETTIEELLRDSNSTQKIITDSKSVVWLQNKTGQFHYFPLPKEAQFGPVYDSLAKDFTKNGNIDILLIGNQTGVDLQLGSNSQLKLLLYEGDGNGSFSTVPLKKSGLSLQTDDLRSLITMKIDTSRKIIISRQNGKLEIFEF